MKSSEQLEQQSLEGLQTPQNKEGVAGQEQLAVEQEKLAQQLEAKKKILEQEQAHEDAELKVVDIQAGVDQNRALKESVREEENLETAVRKNIDSHHETATVIAKPLGSVYAGLSEAQIAVRVEAGKKEAANNVSKNLIPQARELPLVGGIVGWLEKRAA